MNAKKLDPTTKHMYQNRFYLVVEIVLTLCLGITVGFFNLHNLSNSSKKFAQDVDSHYETILNDYITTYNLISGQIKEKIKEDVSFDEMQKWMQSKEESFKKEVGDDIYDGIAITYKGGYAHSWDYGDYSDYDPSARPWYQQAKEGKGDVVVVAPYVTYLEPSQLVNDDYIIMTIAERYSDEVSFDYDIKISEIKEILLDKKVDTKRNDVIYFDKEGYILSSSRSDWYARNVKNADDVISQDLSNTINSGIEDDGKLKLSYIDGSPKLTFITQDANGNYVAMFYSFGYVFVNSLLIVILGTIALILVEIRIYRRNAKRLLDLKNRDKRLTLIIDSSYDGKIFVNIDTMRYYGNDDLAKTYPDMNYYSVYNTMKAFAIDEDTVKFIEEVLSPKVIIDSMDETAKLVTGKIRLPKNLKGEEGDFVYEVNRIISHIDGKRVATILLRDITTDASILREALENAEQASNAKGDFLALMSHEIRTPINAIVGETSLAEKNIDNPEKIKGYLRQIHLSSKHLLNLINDILDMSALENKKMKIANAQFDLKEIVYTSTTTYYAQCKSKGINFETKTIDVDTEILVGDQLRIQQVIFNLLSNSFKFTEAGGEILFSIREVHKVTHGVTVIFKVKDTGCGMSKAYMNHIFRPFEQESALVAKKHGGSGLGLSICKELVEMMGGSIDVESEEGVGTEFTVTIPLSVPGGDVKREGLIKDMNVMVIDDDKENLDYLGSMLNNLGIVNTCESVPEVGMDLMTKARNDGTPYNVCLIDWQMDGLDGIDLAKRIRKGHSAKTPIILMSAYDTNEIMEEAQKAGVDSCMAKPIFESTLFNTLMDVSDGKLVIGKESDEEYDFTGKRALLAEDSAINRKIAKEMLSLVKLEVDEAVNGKEAVAKFEAADPGTYDIILMDVQMPILNGYEATGAIRKLNHPQAKEIPIIAMTADAFVEDIAKSMMAGMNDHIAKPIDIELLYQLISRYVQ